MPALLWPHDISGGVSANSNCKVGLQRDPGTFQKSLTQRTAQFYPLGRDKDYSPAIIQQIIVILLTSVRTRENFQTKVTDNKTTANLN